MSLNSKSLPLAILFLFLSFSQQGSASSIINGLAIHSELGQESFIAGLFTSTPSTDALEILLSDTDKQIQVRVIAKRLSARRFKRMWIEGMAINASGTDLSRQSQNMATFSNLLRVTLVEGDIFSIQRTNDSVKILINGSTLGNIDDPNFFDLLLRTWIGNVPLSSQFRDNLLVAGELDQALLARFNALQPQESRIVAVATALKDREAKQQATPEEKVAIVSPKISQPTINTPALIAPPSPIPEPNVTEPSLATSNEQTDTSPQSQPVVSSQEDNTRAINNNDSLPEGSTDSPEEGSNSVNIAQVNQAAPNLSEESLLEEEEEEFTAESLLEQQLYISQLKRWVYKKLKYPAKSVEREEEGVVRMKVSINRDGALSGVILEQEAEYSRLAKAAIKAVEKSEPFPNFPASIKEDEFSFSLPIVFRLVAN